MLAKFRLKHLLLLTTFGSPIVNAGAYIGLAPALIQIKTDSDSTTPLMADLRLGYALDAHKLEFAVLSSIRDDSLNQLVTDVPTAASVFYRYTANIKSTLHVDLILGYSQIDVETSYIQIPSFTETYEGISFGVGFEEALKSIPELKFKFDFIQLYRGNQLDLNLLSLGLRYEF